MRRGWLIAAALFAACGKGQTGSLSVGSPDAAVDAGEPDAAVADAGFVDAGPVDSGPVDAGLDAGAGDAGISDAGISDAGPADAGPADAGVPKPARLGEITTVPSPDGWDFVQNGLPSGTVMGASLDEGGNLWVAGGTAGVYVMNAGTRSFRGFGIADGLHPYGYLPGGSPADSHPSLDETPAISISGGAAGEAYVGYQGKPGCEDEWDRYGDNHSLADPSVYKSGDADRVVLSGGGINVAHYDIFSGPGVVGNEPAGREKLCTVMRILYDGAQGRVWFGANHGFAMGFSGYLGDPACNGNPGCAGLYEHVHPGVNDVHGWMMTDAYYGIALDTVPHRDAQGATFFDVWFGGMIRTTRFRYGETLGDYWKAQPLTEDWGSGDISGDAKAQAAFWNRMDIWPDPVGERRDPLHGNWSETDPDAKNPADWNFDYVSGIAVMSSGDAWIASSVNGLRHVDHDGKLLDDVTSYLPSRQIGAVARDPSDDSLWIGYRDGSGVTRMRPDGSMLQYGGAALGPNAGSGIWDIQVAPGFPRKLVVAFRRGSVGLFTGK